MSLTKFGKVVREKRRILKVTLSKMATDLNASPAFLSAMETGRNKVPTEWVSRIANYFKASGADVDEQWLKVLACESNESVSLDGLPPHHKMLVAGFANSDLNQEQLRRLGEVLQEIYGEKIADDK